jgi:type 1 glutamine amidotransferase
MTRSIWILLVGSTIVAAQQPPAGGGRGGGRGAGQQNAPAIPNLSQRPSGSSLGTIRVGAADNNLWFGWRVAIPAAEFKQLTFSEVLPKADALAVTGIEISNTQRVSQEVPKPFDYRLQTGERNAVVRRLREYNQSVMAYRVESLGDEATRRKYFEFAKAVNIPLIVTAADGAAAADLEKLADEFDINVAIENRKDAKAALAMVQPRGKRIGLAADPAGGLPPSPDRLMYINLGGNPAKYSDVLLAAYRAGVKPLTIVVSGTGAADASADMQKALNSFERAMWPAMAARVRAMLDTPAGKIRGPEKLDAGMKSQIEAGSPKQAIVPPKKKHKLLVTDIQMYSGHSTIPHGNYMLELMAKNTGVFEPVFSNDQELLKYPKIKEFDAIWLNNVCGMVHNDPEVREGILRFVREGGGIGGHHAVTFANNNWPEFADMMGGWAGAHHTEKQVVKIDDPSSLLTKMFGSAPFDHTDEFYQFPPSSPYSREKQHVLLSIDVERSDRATANRFCPECTRPDQDYGLAWIRTFGKGRTYFTPLGHTTPFYTDPRWTNHVLAAIQYILGDLDADSTPSAKHGKK